MHPWSLLYDDGRHRFIHLYGVRLWYIRGINRVDGLFLVRGREIFLFLGFSFVCRLPGGHLPTIYWGCRLHCMRGWQSFGDHR